MNSTLIVPHRCIKITGLKTGSEEFATLERMGCHENRTFLGLSVSDPRTQLNATVCLWFRESLAHCHGGLFLNLIPLFCMYVFVSTYYEALLASHLLYPNTHAVPPAMKLPPCSCLFGVNCHSCAAVEIVCSHQFDLHPVLATRCLLPTSAFIDNKPNDQHLLKGHLFKF